MDLFDDRAASPMLIAKQAEAFDDLGCIYELKLDGFRCLAYSDKKTVDLRNKKNMRMLPKFPELSDIYCNIADRCILDGEIVVLKTEFRTFCTSETNSADRSISNSGGGCLSACFFCSI